jgi:hypothetical protein
MHDIAVASSYSLQYEQLNEEFLFASVREHWLGSQGNAVGIATGYRLEDTKGQILNSGRGKIFPLSTLSGPILGSTRPPIQGAPETPSSGVKRTGREVDQFKLVPLSKSTWIRTSTPPLLCNSQILCQ